MLILKITRNIDMKVNASNMIENCYKIIKSYDSNSVPLSNYTLSIKNKKGFVRNKKYLLLEEDGINVFKIKINRNTKDFMTEEFKERFRKYLVEKYSVRIKLDEICLHYIREKEAEYIKVANECIELYKNKFLEFRYFLEVSTDSFGKELKINKQKIVLEPDSGDIIILEGLENGQTEFIFWQWIFRSNKNKEILFVDKRILILLLRDTIEEWLNELREEANEKIM